MHFEKKNEEEGGGTLPPVELKDFEENMSDINLINGNCLLEMPKLKSESIDLTVTSPPYDNLRTYNDSLEWGPHVWKPTLKELYRITTQGGVVVWVVGDATIKGSETGTSFKQAIHAIDCGFKLHDTMIYKKPNLPKNHRRYEQDFEYMFIFLKGSIKTFNPIMIKNKQYGRGATGATFRHKGKLTSKIHNDKPIKKERIKGNCWDIDCGYMRSSKDIISFEHPATFPEKLANDHIISWSNEGDTVFDPFMGSGTTGKMAKQLNRKFIGIEKDPRYFEIAQERILSFKKSA